jgi:hypothetical protein
MHADERQAVKTANTLRFWRDVMLGHLEKIRDGEATDETFVALERDLKTSEKEARRAMTVLRTLRSRIGGGQLAKLIDNIVQSDGYGKEVIWYEINSLLTTRKAGNDVKSKALEICNQIAILNGELDRLHRLVYG